MSRIGKDQNMPSKFKKNWNEKMRIPLNPREDEFLLTLMQLR